MFIKYYYKSQRFPGGEMGGGKMRGYFFNWFRVSIWNDKVVLKINSGDFGTALWMYLMLPNYTIKNS